MWFLVCKEMKVKDTEPQRTLYADPRRKPDHFESRDKPIFTITP